MSFRPMTPGSPEVRNNEIFVGNITGSIPTHLKSLKTARLGEKAYDLYGDLIPNMKPLFISRTEAMAYDRIMMDRFNHI